METTCYGIKPMDKLDIQPTRVLILMSSLANLSLNNFIDVDCKICILNEETNNLHTVVMRKFVESLSTMLTRVNEKDRELLNIDDLINDIMISSYDNVTVELLFVNLAKILFEDTSIVKSDKIMEILSLDTNTLLKAINLNLETYTTEEDLDDLNGNMWNLATEIINKIKATNE